ncbi:uncharacterized protein LOC111621114 [Centruroides sculpturatus]|uniref:uncharacterized protein LOC111621114 n=1 Tax=Centruroides sculpturatus TaxID=218467 RepID=UPI000C6E8D5B|nr:uncharacterized protein LOC111621114 [Centruroides sculpturatus]
MKVVYLVAAILLFGAEQSLQQSCHLRELDLCAASMLLFTQGQSSPIAANEEEVTKQCEYITEARHCINNFTNKCTTELQRELLKYVLEGTEKTMDDFCTKGSNLRKEYLKYAPCVSKHFEDQRPCLNDALATLETLEHKKFDERIPTICCGYSRFRKCLSNNVINKCDKEADKLIDKVIQLTATDLLSLICGNYDHSGDKCKGLLPSEGSKPKGSNSNSALGRILSAFLTN